MIIKNAKTILFASLIAAMILPFSGMYFAEAQQDEKSLLKEKIKDKMSKQVLKDKTEQQSKTKHTSEEYGIPYNLIFEDNGKLVVGIDIEKAKEFNREYTVSEVKDDLQTNHDIDVRYYGFVRESAIRGGDTIADLTDDDGAAATITVVKNNRIITTGHGFDVGLYLTVGPIGSTVGCTEVYIYSSPPIDGAFADASLGYDAYNPDCDHRYTNDSIKVDGSTYSVTYGVASDIELYGAVNMMGIGTGSVSSGHILDTSVTVKDKHGVLNDQVVANYASAERDSGAPVYEITGSSTAKLLGQHVGKVCQIDLHSGDNLQQWCSNPVAGIGALTIFTPWDQVETHLGI